MRNADDWAGWEEWRGAVVADDGVDIGPRVGAWTVDDRCRGCGKVPGKWQPTVGGRRDELTLEKCRACGAAWTGRIGSRIGRAKP